MSHRLPVSLFGVTVLLCALCVANPVAAAAPAKKPPAKTPPAKKVPGAISDGLVQTYKSQNFQIYTDLPADEARQLLKQLEAMLKLIANYWGRQPRQVIECCVVKDLNNWSQELQGKMDADGLAKIRGKAGVCITQHMTSGKQRLSKSRVYAVADGGVPLHEAVHAYAHQTFGRAGPRWYAEGMAEMGHYWAEGVKGVNVPKHVIRYLRSVSPPRKLETLIDNEEKTGGSWEDYCWWWLLGYMLDNNPNYFAQYRAFGREMLSGKQITFQDVFGEQLKEMEFELHFFVNHLDNGYRVDLCSWDWKRKFVPRIGSGGMSVQVQADRGWQPSGLSVSSGSSYDFSTSSDWKVQTDGADLTAAGDDKGRGKLVGVVFKSDYTLSDEFELGEKGTFTVPADGNLFVRCRDKWNELADNSGRVTLRLYNPGTKPGSQDDDNQ